MIWRNIFSMRVNFSFFHTVQRKFPLFSQAAILVIDFTKKSSTHKCLSAHFTIVFTENLKLLPCRKLPSVTHFWKSLLISFLLYVLEKNSWKHLIMKISTHKVNSTWTLHWRWSSRICSWSGGCNCTWSCRGFTSFSLITSESTNSLRRTFSITIDQNFL